MLKKTMCFTYQNSILVKIVIIFVEVTSAAPPCDMTTDIELDEGNMGQTSDFNWLGILQVFLNEEDDVQVAVSGIVLIKSDRALASADDIVRIPKRILQHDTRALFFPDNYVAVNYSLVSYVTHPEYQTETFNTLAIILLNIYDDSSLVPICFPMISYDTSYLYLTGFTDENEMLEKMIYRIQYTGKPECEEFYEKEGLVIENRQPISYLCGKGQSSRKRCIWDNGMALVSNSSGWFTLIGFSIHGPGCAAPARFISMLHYSAWIHETLRDNDDEEDYDYMSPNYRRTNSLDTEYIPIHRTFTARQENGTSGPDGGLLEETDGATEATGDLTKATNSSYRYMRWPFTVYPMAHYDVTPSTHDGGTVFFIHAFNDTYERAENDCENKKKRLLYAEDFTLTSTQGSRGTVSYWLSLYDLLTVDCTCVTLEVDCESRTEANLVFREIFEYTSVSETPNKVLQFTVVTERGFTNKNKENNPNLRPTFIELKKPISEVQPNYNLDIKFSFNTKAFLKFKMYGVDEIIQNKTSRSHIKQMKFPRKTMQYWGSSRKVDKKVKVAPLVVDVVLDTVSEASRTDVTPGLVLVALYVFIGRISLF